MRQALGGRPIASLIDLPIMDDPEMQAVMKLCSSMGELAYHANSELFQMNCLRMVKLSCRHGTGGESCVNYAGLPATLGPVFHPFPGREGVCRFAGPGGGRTRVTRQK